MIGKYLGLSFKFKTLAIAMLITFALLGMQASFELQAAPPAQEEVEIQITSFLKDGGFESDLDDWAATSKNDDDVFLTGDAHEGKMSLRLRDGARVAQRFAADAGDKFSFDVWSKSNDGENEVGINFYDAKGDRIDRDSHSRRNASRDYEEEKIEVIAPKETHSVEVYAKGPDGGDGNFDRMSLRRERESIPVRGAPERNLIDRDDFDKDDDRDEAEEDDDDRERFEKMFDEVHGDVDRVSDRDNDRDMIRFRDRAEVKKSFDAEPGDIYEASGRGRANNGRGSMGFTFRDEKGQPIREHSDNFDDRDEEKEDDDRDDDGFERKRVRGVAPMGTHSVEFFAKADAGAEVDIDDVQFMKDRASRPVPNNQNRDNQVRNHGFERDFDDWDKDGELAEKIEISNQSHGGKNAARIRNGANIRQTVPAKAGESYTVHAQTRANRGSGEFGVRFLNANREVLRERGHKASRPNTNSGDSNAKGFNFGRVRVNAPPGTAQMQVFVKADHDSEVDFDDIVVIRDVKSVVRPNSNSENILKDGDLEDARDSDRDFGRGRWSVWRAADGDAKVSDDPGRGSKVLELSNRAFAYQNFAAEPGDEFEFSGMGKGRPAADGNRGNSSRGRGHMGLKFLDDEGNVLADVKEDFDDDDDDGGEGYGSKRVRATAPGRTRSVQAYVESNRGSNVKVDDLRLVPRNKHGSAVAQAKRNNLNNGNFENDMNGWSVERGRSEDARVRNDDSFGGSKSVELHDDAVIHQTKPARPGVGYHLRGMGKRGANSAGGQGHGRIGIQFLDESEEVIEDHGKGIDDDNFRGRNVHAVAPANAKFVRAYGRAHKGGRVILDDLDLVEDVEMDESNKAPGRNLLSDHSFENGLGQWQRWQNREGRVETTNNAKHGKQAGRIRNQAQIFQAFPAKEGEAFHFRGWGRRNSASGFGAIGIRFLDADGSKLADFFEGFEGVEFEFKEISVHAPPNTVIVQPYAWADPGAEIDLDDLEFKHGRPARLTPTFPRVNMMRDHGFEKGQGSWRFDDGVEVIDDDFDGVKAARIPERGRAFQNFPVKSGEVYTFNGWGRAERGRGAVGVRFLDNDGKEVERVEHSFSNRSYRNHRMTVVVPDKAASAEPYAQAHAGGTVVVDAMRLTRDGSMGQGVAKGRVNIDKYPIVSPMVPRRGDVSCDGSNNAVDALVVLQYDVGLRLGHSRGCLGDDAHPSENGMNLNVCDANGDGRCNAIDAMMYLQCDVGHGNPFCSKK